MRREEFRSNAAESYFQSLKIYFHGLKINFHDVKIDFHVMKIVLGPCASGFLCLRAGFCDGGLLVFLPFCLGVRGLFRIFALAVR